jgi:hypothetical protein
MKMLKQVRYFLLTNTFLLNKLHELTKTNKNITKIQMIKHFFPDWSNTKCLEFFNKIELKFNSLG